MRRYPPFRLHRGVNPFYFTAVADYRRNFIPGGSYFFTVNLADRRSRLLTDKIGLLRSALRMVMQRHPFTTEAVVVLPEHLHCIWTLPPGDTDFATRWRLIKTDFSRALWENEAISKSAVQTGALKRIGDPDEMAGAVVYFAAAASSFTTGQTLVLDGGGLA